MRIFIVATIVGLSIVGLSAAADAGASIRQYTNIPAQDLGPALRSLAKERSFQIVYASRDVTSLRTRGAVGELTPDEALKQLLSETGLSYRYLDETTVTIFPAVSASSTSAQGASTQTKSERSARSFFDRIRLAQADNSSPSQGEGGGEEGGEGERKSEGKSDEEGSIQEVAEEVLVTGTHIRGIAPESSPLAIYDREYLEKAGIGTAEQFARHLPQNLSSTDSLVWGHSLVAANPGLNQAGSAYAGQAGINLHGLGPSSTLVLLNGHRLAPAGTSSDFVDISSIPMSAIERIEVLTDGASALYGADAIAGVVNFVLRKNFIGAETSVRGSGAQGGGDQFTASQLLGTSWNGGSGLVVADYNKQTSLLSHKRDFIPKALVSTTLLPESSRRSLFLAGQQEFPLGIAVSIDSYYSEQDIYTLSGRGEADSPNFLVATGDIRNYGGALGLSRKLLGDWQIDLAASYSKSQQEQNGERWTLGEIAPASYLTPNVSNTAVLQADLHADGSLFELGKQGAIKLAVGLGARSEASSTPFAQFRVGETLKREIRSAFAEIFVPITSAASGVPFAKRLELSLAARYDSYNGGLGSSVDPKIGLLWAPVGGLRIRGTYATSYRAPLLDQMVFLPSFVLRNLPDQSSPDGTTLTLVNGSNGVSLRPEESDTFTVGVDIRPTVLPSFLFTATYYKTSFNGRISVPPLIGGLSNLYNQEVALGPLIQRSPDLADVETIFRNGWVINPEQAPAGAASVEAVFDFRLLNIALSERSGVDASASYAFSTRFGEINTSLGGTYLIDLRHQAIPASLAIDFLNKIGQPMDLRLRGGVSWSNAGFSSSLTANYSAGYENHLFTPASDVASWTTADLHLGYDWRGDAPRMLQGLKIYLNVQNVTDEDPPFVESPFTFVGIDGGYDAVNASPVGRLIALHLSKTW